MFAFLDAKRQEYIIKNANVMYWPSTFLLLSIPRLDLALWTQYSRVNLKMSLNKKKNKTKTLWQNTKSKYHMFTRHIRALKLHPYPTGPFHYLLMCLKYCWMNIMHFRPWSDTAAELNMIYSPVIVNQNSFICSFECYLKKTTLESIIHITNTYLYNFNLPLIPL